MEENQPNDCALPITRGEDCVPAGDALLLGMRCIHHSSLDTMGKGRKPAVCNNCYNSWLQSRNFCRSNTDFCLFLTRFGEFSSIKHKFRAESVWTGCFLPIRDLSGVSNPGECGHLFPHLFTKCVKSTYHPLTHLQHLCFHGTKHISTKGIKEHRLFLSFSQQSSSNFFFFFSFSEKTFQKMKLLWGL